MTYLAERHNVSAFVHFGSEPINSIFFICSPSKSTVTMLMLGKRAFRISQATLPICLMIFVPYHDFIAWFEIHLTNRYQVAVRLFSNRAQSTSKCGKNKKVAHEAQRLA